MALGFPAYSFQYKNQTANVDASTRTISGLNLKTDENNTDGITPDQFLAFINNLFEQIGITYGTEKPKLLTNQLYEIGG